MCMPKRRNLAFADRNLFWRRGNGVLQSTGRKRKYSTAAIAMPKENRRDGAAVPAVCSAHAVHAAIGNDKRFSNVHFYEAPMGGAARAAEASERIAYKAVFWEKNWSGKAG